MDELLEQFLIERRELVQQAADDLIALETEPGARALIDGAFRAIHTLKGSTALFDFGARNSGAARGGGSAWRWRATAT